jgi:predicted transcriptional regulator
MSEKIKMTDSELAEVKMLQEKFQQKMFQLGQWALQKMDAEERTKSVNQLEIKLQEEWKSLQKMENELIEKLLNKYGEGSLDLAAGTFISEKNSTPAS